jgi:predicted secreted hydrolase
MAGGALGGKAAGGPPGRGGRLVNLPAAGLALLLAFQPARPGYRFRFPRDHGAHPAFATEWWYFTGHLWSADGARRYGYQLTFFREGLAAGDYRGSAAWRSDAIHLAHAAVTYLGEGRFRFETRLNRQGLPAAAAVGRLDLRNAAWTARMAGPGRIHLAFTVGAADLELDLASQQPPVVFGEDGIVRKGADPACASHYVSFPRLATTGTFAGRRREVLHGLSWMDHEFSSSRLAPGLVGWDWAGIQLKDGRSLMAYRLRRADGSQDPWSLVSEVDPAGRVARTTRAFRMAGGAWRSPDSGAVYPLPLRLEALGETWTLEPLLADQELRTRAGTPITYWEGACRVRDGQGREAGEAYVELTGYAHSMQGRF